MYFTEYNKTKENNYDSFMTSLNTTKTAYCKQTKTKTLLQQNMYIITLVQTEPGNEM